MPPTPRNNLRNAIRYIIVTTFLSAVFHLVVVVGGVGLLAILAAFMEGSFGVFAVAAILFLLCFIISRWCYGILQKFYNGQLDDTIPESLFVRVFPCFIPLLYCLVLVALGYYYAPEYNETAMAKLMCRGMPHYFLCHMANSARPYYMSSVTAEGWSCVPLFGTIFSTLVSAGYVFYVSVYKNVSKSRKIERGIFGIFVLLFLCGAIGYTAWAFRYEYRKVYLLNDFSVETVRDEHGGDTRAKDFTDLSPFYPFTRDNKLAFLGVPELQITSNCPKLHGAYALFPIYAAAANAIYPLMESDSSSYYYEKTEAGKYVRGGTSPEAIESLLSGESDMIFMLQPSAEQLRKAEEMGKTLEITPIGREAFVFFVSKINPVDDLTSQQIRDIYSRKIVNWKELGGSDETILPFQRPEGSGSQTAMLRFMEGEPMCRPMREEVQFSMMGIVNRVADYRNYGNSIGYSFRFYVQGMVEHDGVKVIGLDGMTPTLDTISDGSYPVLGELVIITAGSNNPNVPKLTQWFLSPQGQDLVRRVGYVPIGERSPKGGRN